MQNFSKKILVSAALACSRLGIAEEASLLEGATNTCPDMIPDFDCQSPIATPPQFLSIYETNNSSEPAG